MTTSTEGPTMIFNLSDAQKHDLIEKVAGMDNDARRSHMQSFEPGMEVSHSDLFIAHLIRADHLAGSFRVRGL